MQPNSHYTLSILIPSFNEEKTIGTVLEKIRRTVIAENVSKEIVVIDDCSIDKTKEIVEDFLSKHPEISLHYLKHSKNQGKGAAIRTGIKNSTGDFIVIQDADLEYNPAEYITLLQPLIDGVADVVYGSRFVGGKPHRILFYWHSIGNKFLTNISNLFTNLNLTDMETCYKAFRSEILKNIELKENRFGFEPEITAKISKLPQIRIYEVGISYFGRTYAEGKKINWKDGVRAIYCILKYNLF